MINRNLTRRSEDLESRFQPAVGEPRVINIQFVAGLDARKRRPNNDFEVVSQMQITLDAPVANEAVRERDQGDGVATGDNAVDDAGCRGGTTFGGADDLGLESRRQLLRVCGVPAIGAGI
jgi:hypothetical protein